MSSLIAIGRLVFGLALLLPGLDYQLDFLPLATPATGLATDLTGAFAAAGLLPFAASVLLFASFLVLFDRYTVAALSAPTAILICGFHWSLLAGDRLATSVSALLLLLNGGLLLAYWPHVGQLFAMRSETAPESDPRWLTAEKWSRWIWGGWWIVSGLFHFVTGPILGTRPAALGLMLALLGSGLYEVLKAIEALGGLAVLFWRWAPLALLVNLPITVVVVWWDFALQDPGGILGLLITIATLGPTWVLMRAYRTQLAPLLAWRPRHRWQD